MALGLGLSECEIHSSEHTRRWSRRILDAPTQWGHFGVDCGGLLLVLMGEEKHFWQLNEEFIWNVLRCGRRFACTSKSYKWKHEREYSYEFIQLLEQSGLEFSQNSTKPVVHKILRFFFFVCVCIWRVCLSTSLLAESPQILRKLHIFHGISLCTAVCMETFFQERKTENMRKNQRKRLGLTSEFCSWFYGGRLRQDSENTGSKTQELRNVLTEYMCCLQNLIRLNSVALKVSFP